MEVEYEATPFVTDLEAAMAPNAPLVYAEGQAPAPPNAARKGNVTGPLPPPTLAGARGGARGDIEKGFAKAEAFGLDRKKVRVITEHMGGGFGSKLSPSAVGSAFAVIACRLARTAGAPVKLMLNRHEEQLCTGNGPGALVTVRLGAKAIGWERRHRIQGDAPGPKKRGIGMANGNWYVLVREAVAAEVQVHRDGSVELFHGAQDLGTGIRTALAVIAAEELGLTAADITVHVGDTRSPPGRPRAGASPPTPRGRPRALPRTRPGCGSRPWSPRFCKRSRTSSSSRGPRASPRP